MLSPYLTVICYYSPATLMLISLLSLHAVTPCCRHTLFAIDALLLSYFNVIFFICLSFSLVISAVFQLQYFPLRQFTLPFAAIYVFFFSFRRGDALYGDAFAFLAPCRRDTLITIIDAAAYCCRFTDADASPLMLSPCYDDAFA